MAQVVTGPQARRQRGPSIVFSTLALAICFLMLAALKPSQPPPPPTAEYAPEAVQALTDAPDEQTSEAGTGEDGAESGGGEPTPGPNDPAVADPDEELPETDRSHECVGNPPRQIRDPQAPPCIAGWTGDNGGETYAGVDETTIRVGMPAERQGTVTPRLVNFFNERFEFYGREIEIVSGGCGGDTPGEMQACADVMAEKDIFASLSFSDKGGLGYFYYDALATKYRILSIAQHPDVRTEADFAAKAPYQWAYMPSFDKAQRHIADFMCTQLAPRPAANAGGRHLNAPRKFALVSNRYTSAPSPNVTVVKAALGACGIDIDGDGLHREIDWEQAGVNQSNETTRQQATNAVIDFNTADVTTVLCLCHTATAQQLTPAAESQGYQPEWVISSYLFADQDLWASAQPSGQWSHAMGLTFWNKWDRLENMAWHWALQDIDPGYNYESNRFVYFGAFWNYHQLLLLASGIQMAGPTLTPDTFQQGLWDASPFPNPDMPPVFEGKVGFGDRDHTFVDDAAIIWWNPAGADPYYGGNGNYCYVRNGQRNALGAYPAAYEPFQLPCRRY